MTASTAKLSNYRQAPRKVRLLADLVRGKTVEYALSQLTVLPKRAAEPMQKLIRSALANAEKSGLGPKELVISKIEVNGGVVFSRIMPRARGRGAPIQKKTSHITLALSPKVAKSKSKKTEPASEQKKEEVKEEAAVETK